jgi:hypothetical protein
MIGHNLSWPALVRTTQVTPLRCEPLHGFSRDLKIGQNPTGWPAFAGHDKLG